MRQLSFNNQNDYLGCFEDCKKHWNKCIASVGEYFEGDETDFEEKIRFFFL